MIPRQVFFFSNHTFAVDSISPRAVLYNFMEQLFFLFDGTIKALGIKQYIALGSISDRGVVGGGMGHCN